MKNIQLLRSYCSATSCDPPLNSYVIDFNFCSNKWATFLIPQCLNYQVLYIRCNWTKRKKNGTVCEPKLKSVCMCGARACVLLHSVCIVSKMLIWFGYLNGNANMISIWTKCQLISYRWVMHKLQCKSFRALIKSNDQADVLMFRKQQRLKLNRLPKEFNR